MLFIGLSDFLIAFMFGTTQRAVNQMLTSLRDFIYAHDAYLMRSRNLADPR